MLQKLALALRVIVGLRPLSKAHDSEQVTHLMSRDLNDTHIFFFYKYDLIE